MFIVNKKGLALIKQVNELYELANELGISINWDDTEDDSLACVSDCLNIIPKSGIEDQEEFDLDIGGDWEACLPYLTQI